MKQQQAVSASSLRIAPAFVLVPALSLALALAGCADGPGSMSMPAVAPTPSTPMVTPLPLVASSVGSARDLPATLRTPLGQSLFLLVSGTGVQVYSCADRAGFHWALEGPEATLTDARGVAVGKHYAGPTWESTDGSKVVGAVSATASAPDASAIPWLLLSVKSTSGSGVLTQTKSIQRLQTVGGVMPTTACTTGQTARVPYAATYAFFRAAP